MFMCSITTVIVIRKYWMNLVRIRRWHSNSQNHSNADAIICQNIWSKPPTVTVKIKDAIQASHVAQLLPQPFPLRSSGFVTVEQLLRRNHEGKPPSDIVRRIVFELRKLLAVRKTHQRLGCSKMNWSEKTQSAAPTLRSGCSAPCTRSPLTCGRCLPPAHASASAFTWIVYTQ
jgi:hypothetical protein